ncbi:lysophospholipase [Gordonia sp. HY002]|uniref:alpha/beta hydrolase n=1 Tax=Gordonia zhenghanii TaxID=2911516 RepID=UPI001EEFD793|nr:alpha/beta hydrolase [Gordonia zhenghanii]MCF8572063.1 lysophospholipase [Gordonia zhenghanii]MCF8602937.1 lysophospholipase [Gordonia zhenghanii]
MSIETSSVTGRHGITIVYDVHRPDTEPVGVVVVAHGLGDHAGRYHHVAKEFTDRGYLVVAPDQAGHGRSGGKRLGVTDFSDFTADLDTVINAVDVDGPRFLLGHSMGGAVALSYALDHQDRLDGLILTGPALVPGEDLPSVLVKMAPVLGKVVPWMPATALPASGVSRDPKVVADYESDPLVWHGGIRAGLGGALIREMKTYPDRLPSLKLPLLILHGGADVLTNPDGTRMAARLAGSDDVTSKIYPGMFHEIFNEPEQDEVLEAVTDWVVAHTV